MIFFLGVKALRSYGIVWKNFFRNPFYMVLLLLGSVYLFLHRPQLDVLPDTINYDWSVGAVNLISSFLSAGTFVGFGIFLLLSFETLRQVGACGLEETLLALPKGLGKTRLLQLTILLLWILVYWILALMLCLLPLPENIPGELRENVFLATILYVFLPSLGGLLLGSFWQRLGKRIPFYAFFIFSMFMLSSMSEAFFLTAGQLGTALGGEELGAGIQKLLSYWYRLPPIYNSLMDPCYGIAVEPWRFALAFFWCLLGLGGLLLGGRGKRAKTAGSMAILLCLCCAVLSWQRGSDPIDHMAPSMERHVQGDYHYYETAPEPEPSFAEFSVTAYDLELDFFAELKVRAKLTLDGKFCRSYVFTLYHGYRLSSVEDGAGQGLSFVQEGDYISVKNPGQEPLESLTFIYAGFHPELYSSPQGAYLPGYFPFYPREGRQEVFHGHDLSVGFVLSEPREFALRTNAPVFCNLTAQEDGSYFGTVQSLTVVSGMYREEKLGDVTYVLPWASRPEELMGTATEKIRKLNEALGTEFSVPEVRAVFYSPDVAGPLPSGGTGKCVALGDTLLIGTTYGGADIPQLVEALCHYELRTAPQSPAKEWFFAILSDVLTGDNTGTRSLRQTFGTNPLGEYVPLKSIMEEENQSRAVGFYLYKAIKQGVGICKLYDYLAQGGGDDLAFAKALAKGE